jgi:hypothetical protein
LQGGKVYFFGLGKEFQTAVPQIMDIVDMAIQVGGAREGQSFVLKI